MEETMESEKVLDDLDARFWAILERATSDRRHAWRFCAFGTCGLASHAAPSARMVVLRAVDRRTRSLTFFSDVRSQKIAELAANPAVSLLFWDTKAQWQLRMQAHVEVVKNGEALDNHWQRIKSTRGALDYQSVLRPGAPLNDVQGSGAATALHSDAGLHAFSMLCATASTCDSLELRREGHRRAYFDYVHHTGRWLKP
jgi:pyridoxamine 5'-phosphate oxidase